MCSEDDASDTDRLYNIFAICRKAMDENAEFQCKREPAIIEAGKCAEKETLPKGLRERSSSKNQEDEVKDDGDEQAELHNQPDANIDAFLSLSACVQLVLDAYSNNCSRLIC